MVTSWSAKTQTVVKLMAGESKIGLCSRFCDLLILSLSQLGEKVGEQQAGG